MKSWTPTAKRNETAVAVYLKYPEPGKVKTRLAAECGAARATEAYLAMVSYLMKHTLQPAGEAGFDIVLCTDPFRAEADYHTWFSPYSFFSTPQQGNDLGERLQRSFARLLESYDAVITIGTDCPTLAIAHLEEARRLLSTSADLALGPARDGGYYLIGLSKPEPRLFDGIAWSSDSVLRETLERATEKRLKVELLEPLRDIDTREDLLRCDLPELSKYGEI